MNNYLHPLPLSSVNGSLDLFTGVLYYIQILGLKGLLRPAAPSSNGGVYLEVDTFPSEEEGADQSDFLWYFHPGSGSAAYQYQYRWGLASRPASRVRWTAGDTEADDFLLQLWNNNYSAEAPQDFMNYYEEATRANGLWNLEPVDLANFTTRMKTEIGISSQLIGYGYRMRGLNVESPVTFSTSPKSLRGWWLRIPNGDNNGQGSRVDRYEADEILIFQPARFKLYAEIEIELEEFIMGSFGNSSVFNGNCNSRDVKDGNGTEGMLRDYKIFIQIINEELFEGVTLIEVSSRSSKEEKVVRKFFDFEMKAGKGPGNKGLKVEGTYSLARKNSDKTLSSFDKVKGRNCVAYREEFEGIRHQIPAKVSGVANVMSPTGTLVRNVLVEDPKLLRHLIESRGYKGPFLVYSGTRAARDPAAHAMIQIDTLVRGRVPVLQ